MPQEYGLGRGLASLIPPKKQIQNLSQRQSDDSLNDTNAATTEDKSDFSSKWEEKFEFKKRAPSVESGMVAEESLNAGIENEIIEEVKSEDAITGEGEGDAAKEEVLSGEIEEAVVATTEKTEIETPSVVGASGATEVDVEKIKANPFQPRANFDENRLEELSQSIKRHGVIQPLIVTKAGDNYELIAGERRLQAAKKAGVRMVPVVIKDVDEKEKMEWAIIENIQRHDLNPIEEARAYKRLMEADNLNQDEVAEKMGKSRSFVANKIRLLDLPAEVQNALIEENITEGHAKAILSLSDNEKRRGLLELILKNNLTVRQTEKRSGEIEVKKHKRNVTSDPYFKELEDRVENELGTKVRIRKSGGEGGKIVIEYYSQEELNGIMDKIAPRELAQRK
ncbi:MAG: ParB/RepB/Spo0J family partition protein [Candidatus Moranbacteria bacterium]|nr:ParB/RepB/Spo0J family partition protein [Candidatus Moranbacteria bacterium]